MIILASASPRRCELLKRVTEEFEVIPSTAIEISDGDRVFVAEQNSRLKAAAVSRMRPGDIVIGADTVVYRGGRIYGKPKDAIAALAMLTALNGKSHEVVTGITVTNGKKTRTASEISEVTLNLPVSVIDEYVAKGNALDKAGGYGIQDEAIAPYVAYKGDYDNIIGLPIRLLEALMKEFD